MALEEFRREQKEKERGFQAEVIPAGERADEGMPGILLRAGKFPFLEESDFFLQSLCKAERQSLSDKIWGKTLCQMLSAVLEKGDGRLLSEIVLCAKTERPCSTQLEKGKFHCHKHKIERSLPCFTSLAPEKSPENFGPSGE